MTTVASLLVVQEDKDNENFFWIGSFDVLSLKSGSALPVRDGLLKFFDIGQCPWPSGTPRIQLRRHQSGLPAPKHNISNSASKSGCHRTSEAHYTQYTMERIVNAMEENPKRENIIKVWKIIPLKMLSLLLTSDNRAEGF